MGKNDKEEYKDIPPMKFSYLIKGFALSAIVSGYIIGPLLVIGGGTFWLYKSDYVSKIYVIIAIIVSFIFSNWLIIARSKNMLIKFNKKLGMKDPTKEQVAQWKKNRPASYKFDDEEEEKK
jgi:hypothetical protein